MAFDRRLNPRFVNRGTVRIESGAARAALSVRFDPVTKEIIAVPFDGSPLIGNVVYRLRIEHARDLDDQPMSEPFVVTFEAGAEEGVGEPLPTGAYADVAPVFANRCAGDACHGPGPPALGLDLSSPEGIRRTALGVESRELGAPTVGVEGARGALVLAGMPIVDVVGGVGRPATSYLMYKILGDPHVLGDPMPPASEPLLDAELSALSSWILAGAPTF